MSVRRGAAGYMGRRVHEPGAAHDAARGARVARRRARPVRAKRGRTRRRQRGRHMIVTNVSDLERSVFFIFDFYAWYITIYPLYHVT